MPPNKILIIFDTNKIRSTNKGEVDYSSFRFGGDFLVIQDFINKNGLTDFVHLAVPESVIEEIKMQAKRKLNSDIDEFNKLSEKLGKIGVVKNGPEMKEEFIPELFVDDNASVFAAGSGGKIKIIGVKNENHPEVLKRLKYKCFNCHKPFKGEGNHGFKDALIFEEVFNGEIDYKEYNEIIFYTDNQKDFEGCDDQFVKKFDVRFRINGSWENLESELKEKYSSEILTYDFESYAKSEYFTDYIKKSVCENNGFFDNDGNQMQVDESEVKIIYYDFDENVFIDEDKNEISAVEITAKVEFKGTSGLARVLLDKEDKQILSFEFST